MCGFGEHPSIAEASLDFYRGDSDASWGDCKCCLVSVRLKSDMNDAAAHGAGSGKAGLPQVDNAC